MMATQTPNSGAAQNVIRTNLSSLHNSLRVAQILSVPAGYSQMKKDSVQAVFIQSHLMLPDDIGLVAELPNSIGLVPVILTTNGEWDLNHINIIYSVQHSNHVNDVHEVQMVGVHKLFNSYFMATVFSLYSDFNSSSSFISDSYFFVMPLVVVFLNAKIYFADCII